LEGACDGAEGGVGGDGGGRHRCAEKPAGVAAEELVGTVLSSFRRRRQWQSSARECVDVCCVREDELILFELDRLLALGFG
jgi:hypothetical protein